MVSKEFLTAGHAIFTVSNPSGEHYTYKVSAPPVQRDPNHPVLFVKVLTGPNNQIDYSYLGVLLHDGRFVLSEKSKFKNDSKAYLVCKWAIGVIWRGQKLIPEGYRIDHAGKCGRCGRTLSTPESISLGLGPECAKFV